MKFIGLLNTLKNFKKAQKAEKTAGAGDVKETAQMKTAQMVTGVKMKFKDGINTLKNFKTPWVASGLTFVGANFSDTVKDMGSKIKEKYLNGRADAIMETGVAIMERVGLKTRPSPPAPVPNLAEPGPVGDLQRCIALGAAWFEATANKVANDAEKAQKAAEDAKETAQTQKAAEDAKETAQTQKAAEDAKETAQTQKAAEDAKETAQTQKAAEDAKETAQKSVPAGKK